MTDYVDERLNKKNTVSVIFMSDGNNVFRAMSHNVHDHASEHR